MIYKRIILIVLPILILWFIIHYYFAIDFRFAKEKFLIKRNYEKNIQYFSNLSTDFETYPKLRIDFAENDFFELFLSSQDLFVSHNQKDTNSIYYYPEISWLEITDTNMIFHHEVKQYQGLNFWISDSLLSVKTGDSILEISSLWQISYKGYSKTKHLNQIYKVMGLDKSMVSEIKDKLIRLNCFGYEKNINNDLILNHRGNGIDFFSYLILNDSTDNSFLNNSPTVYGKISSNLYWYNNERFHVSYSPYLKLRSRKIK